MKFQYSEDLYNKEIDALFVRFPSVQKSTFNDAYKPGLEHMRDFMAILGNPEQKLKTIHIAGTNGKGSTSNMIAAALTACGVKTGLYTSPHILDFRERMRIGNTLVSKEFVFDFIMKWKETFERLDLSFFEITTAMAFEWFFEQKVDAAVIEVGLGGRLDSTNIIKPLLSIVTSIGLDHCSILGNTVEEIAAEKAGIFKEGVPALVGEADEHTEGVFRQKAQEVGAPLTFAQSSDSPLANRFEDILCRMDLQGEYQAKNLRTVLSALKLLKTSFSALSDEVSCIEGITHTAKIMDFHGRWEKLGSCPEVICDIGHNAHALVNNFRQIEKHNGPVTIVYGIMADKDLDEILPLMPRKARYILAAPSTSRAMDAESLLKKFKDYFGDEVRAEASESVEAAVKEALGRAREDELIYIGGSTFVVSEATPLFK